MKFNRKKATPIDAEQFHHPATSPRGVRTEEDGRAYVVTMHEQKVYLENGDWIVAEPDGIHFYPIKDKIFQQLYESVKKDALAEHESLVAKQNESQS